MEAGILTMEEDPSHKQKAIYSLTPMGVDLLPVLANIGIWGRKHLPVTKESGANAAALERGGPALCKEMRSALRRAHSTHGA